MSYIIMFMSNSNEPIKFSHLQKLANQSKMNGVTCDKNGQKFF